MDLQAIIACGGSGLVIILSLIKIPKLELNIWGLLGRTIGRSINKELTQQVTELKKDIETNTEAVRKLEDRLEKHCDENEENEILHAHTQILRFNDEILHNKRHSEEHFNEIIEVIDRYETYCNTHPKFTNNKAVMSMQNIKDEYNNCLTNHTFM